jgi:hypothetical protein
MVASARAAKVPSGESAGTGTAADQVPKAVRASSCEKTSLPREEATVTFTFAPAGGVTIRPSFRYRTIPLRCTSSPGR